MFDYTGIMKAALALSTFGTWTSRARSRVWCCFRKVRRATWLPRWHLWAKERRTKAQACLFPVIDASSPSANKKIDKFGQWDAIHVFEASERGRTASYKLTSTVMLSMTRKDQETVGDFTLSGSLTRQMSVPPHKCEVRSPPAQYKWVRLCRTQDAALDPTLPAAHVANIGRLIEDQEQKMRGAMQEVYNERTKVISREQGTSCFERL